MAAEKIKPSRWKSAKNIVTAGNFLKNTTSIRQTDREAPGLRGERIATAPSAGDPKKDAGSEKEAERTLLKKRATLLHIDTTPGGAIHSSDVSDASQISFVSNGGPKQSSKASSKWRSVKNRVIANSNSGRSPIQAAKADVEDSETTSRPPAKGKSSRDLRQRFESESER